MKAVDLGLSVYWGESLLEIPNKHFEENLFTWGDDSYNYAHNKVYEEDDYEELANSGIITDDGFLTPQYDHSTQILGKEWRMPKADEFKELIDKCKWTWLGDGYAVTGPNKNSIKIPYKMRYRDTGRRVLEEIWYEERPIEKKIFAEEIGNFWSSEVSYDLSGDIGFYYGAYCLYLTKQETGLGVRITSDKRSKKNLIIPVTHEPSLLKEDDATPIKANHKRPSFIAPDAWIDDYADTPFDNIVPPPIVRNGERFPLPFWNKLSDKAKVFLKEQWGINCENEYNKLLNDMEEVYILEHALKNYGLI
jgi:hypothetical protein